MAFVISPTRPRTPRHKGKVESGVHYVQRNFMAGREFLDIHTANQHLRTWVRERAGTRDHGTTHKAPLYLFNEHEQAALLALPEDPFTLREVKPVNVHPDCHVRIDKSYYSVPYILRRAEAGCLHRRADRRNLPGSRAGCHPRTQSTAG